MAKINFNETFIYRHRYQFCYGLIALALLAILFYAVIYSPGGISDNEVKSVITSNSINIKDIKTLSVSNLPYYLLQRASIRLFGVSILSIKLASIILAFFSAIGIVLLLKRWFKPSIAILSSLIAISTGQFIFFAQDGTPEILYIFWAIWLLLLSSIIISQQKCKIYYIVAFYIVAALSLYTPLSIYALIALVCSIILHPHLRFLVKKLSKIKITFGIIIAIAMSAPLAIAIINSPKLIFELLGLPSKFPNIFRNLNILGSQFLGFTKPTGSTIMMPFFELGSMIIVSIGIYYVIKNRVTAKNYVIILLSLFILTILLINPIFTSVSFLPIVLLLASGLNGLLAHWNNLFPRNPYAKAVGLIPLTILVSVLVFSGADRYIYGYNYDPNIVSSFSKDLNFITKGKSSKYLIVSDKELEFYNIIARYNSKINILKTPTTNEFWSTREAKKQYPGYYIAQIYTSPLSNNSDRFYLYKKIAN